MGSGPRAYLAYGIDLGTAEDWKAEPKSEYGSAPDEWTEGGGIGTKLDEAILKASGFTEPEPDFYPADYVRPEYGHPDYWKTQDPTPEWRAWSARKNGALKALGVAYDTSGYGGGGEESTGHVLLIESTKKTIEWTETLTLGVQGMADAARDGAGQRWNRALQEVCEAAGLTPENQPGWLMYAYYG